MEVIILLALALLCALAAWRWGVDSTDVARYEREARSGRSGPQPGWIGWE